MDDFNTDDIIDEIISSPPTKRKENRESKSLDSSLELKRSTKSVTFVDHDELSDWDKSDHKEVPEVAGKVASGNAEAGKSTAKGRPNDFDDENPPLSGLDTPRSEESSIAFPDDSPRKASGGGTSGTSGVHAPKKGFDMFTTSSTVREELVPKAKKKSDFDSFLGNLSASSYTGTSVKEEADDQLNSSGSAYQPWASSKKSRPATGDASAAVDIESVLQSVDLTLKKRPPTAPMPSTVDRSVDSEEKPAKKTLSRLMADDDDMFATVPVRPRKQQRPPLSQPPPSPPPPPQTAAPAETLSMEPPDLVAVDAHPPAEATEDGAEAMLAVTRPPTGRRARGGGDYLAGLFNSSGIDNKPAESFFSVPNIPLSSEMKIELESEIKKLRREKEDLKQQNDELQQKLKDETARLEDSNRRKLIDTEELFKRREDMVQKENDQLKQKYNDTLRQMDQERTNMRSEFNRQLDELTQEKRRDLDQLREQHRNDVEALRSAAPHAGALSNLVDRLSHLSEKLGSLSDRETTYRLKDEVLKQTEASDRQVMHEVVQSLRVRVDESARSERWLNDLATQLMEERRALAAERAELRVLKLTEGSRQADSEAERLALAEERSRLQELEARLRHGRSEVLRQKSDTETLAEELKLKEEKLMDGQRSLEERLEMVSRREKVHREQQARMDAAALEQTERAKRADDIQSQLAELRAKEREVSQAMIQLAEERTSLDKRAAGLLCANCRTPVRDSAAAVGIGGGLKVASSMDFAFARSRNWDDLDEEKLYLESLSHAPY